MQNSESHMCLEGSKYPIILMSYKKTAVAGCTARYKVGEEAGEEESANVGCSMLCYTTIKAAEPSN